MLFRDKKIIFQPMKQYLFDSIGRYKWLNLFFFILVKLKMVAVNTIK